MKNNIRVSILEDAPTFEDIKNKLPMPNNESLSQQGGFLLGTDIKTYEFFIANGICLTAFNKNRNVGFGIILPDHLVKHSDLWEKRDQVKWEVDIDQLVNNKIAYIEQLAFLKGNPKLSLVLAYNLLKRAFDDGADFILTTTVKKPIKNTAAIPYIKSIGGLKIGNIDEMYPLVGNINSDIYLIRKKTFDSKIKKLSFYNFLQSNEL